eukprot:TRINITY_DN5771_c0_g1_i3.p2 TRINITY_DN5771_c0_g1~~TRINITY_DN5771_c0_g1_i3.p2  ORF type:complete len:130 (-),score=32.49 TRINITY_DN5771_c0_g1_i3:640-1029(-)
MGGGGVLETDGGGKGYGGGGGSACRQWQQVDRTSASMSPHLLLADLHLRLLRALAHELGVHPCGLQQAARQLRRQGKLSSKTASKLARIEAANAIVRHITAIGCVAYVGEIASELAKDRQAKEQENEQV